MNRIPNQNFSFFLQMIYFDFFKNKNRSELKKKLLVWFGIFKTTVFLPTPRWRIGNGQQIEIHKANWIPKLLTFKPMFKPNMPTNALVSELINEKNHWDQNLIYIHFDKLDVDSIEFLCREGHGKMKSFGTMRRKGSTL